jgi:hypothetical protein
MASKHNIDALVAAQANAAVVRLKSEIATTEATLVVLRAKLDLAKAEVNEARDR